MKDGPELAECYEEAQVLCLPSRREGVPLVLLEAMSFGLPVIATPVGGISDYVAHEDNGLLVPPGDVDALAVSIAALAADPAPNPPRRAARRRVAEQAGPGHRAPLARDLLRARSRLTVRVAFVYRNLNRSGSLERDSVFLLEGLAARGSSSTATATPGRASTDGVFRHDVAPLTRSTPGSASRSSAGLRRARDERASADRTATRPRARRLGLGARRRHAPPRDGRGAGALAAARRPRRRAPGAGKLARSSAEVGAVRTIERLQFRPGRYLRATVVTDEVHDDLIRVHGVPPERIEVVPPAVDVARFAGAKDGRLRHELAIEPEGNVILFIGHVFERKGLGDAVAALAQSRD